MNRTRAALSARKHERGSEVYSYVTKRTFDSRQWDTLKRKAILSTRYVRLLFGREAAGDGDLATSAAEISAIASDNPLILEQFDISEQITPWKTWNAPTPKSQRGQAEVAKARAEIARTRNT